MKAAHDLSEQLAPRLGRTARPRAAGPLSPAAARRIALAAQGFGASRPGLSSAGGGPVTMRHIQRVIDVIGVVQIDPVGVLCRSHYLPFFSRLGNYPVRLLERTYSNAPRRLVEYWAHEASFVPPLTHRLLRWRMDRAAQEAWTNVARTARERPDLMAELLQVVAEHGPLTSAAVQGLASDADEPRTRGQWGSWSDSKRVLAFLFWSGQITSAGRTGQFERLYAMPAQVIPPQVLAAEPVDPEEARRGLVRIAARALGVASETCLRDYFRLKPAETRSAVADLVERGELEPVSVQGWARPGFLHRDAQVPRRIESRALLSPFDSLVWDRPRTLALWDFRLRLEIYTPVEKRVYGYYVLPFLLGEDVVARVDLKAGRAAGGDGTLRVRGAWLEAGFQAKVVAPQLAEELRLMASWLGLSDIDVEPVGDLAGALGRQLAPKKSARPAASASGASSAM